MSEAGAPPPVAWSDRAVAIAAVALAALVLLPGLGRSSLWWDECHSLQMARAVLDGSLARVANALAHGFSPYFALLAPVARESTSEVWLRFPSVLAALGLVLVATGIGRDLGGPALAWRLGVAVAVSPFVAWHAREVRWYTLAWLLAALSLRQGLRAARGGGGRSLAAAAAWGILAAMVFSPAIVLLPPILVAAIGARPAATGEGRTAPAGRPLRRLLVAGAVLAIVVVAGFWIWKVLLGPALGGGAAGLGFTNLGNLSPAAVAYTGVAMATGYTIGPGPIEWHQSPPVMPTPIEMALLGAGVLLLAALALRGALLLRRIASARVALLLLVESLLPVAALAAAAVWTGHRYAPRHAGMMVLPVLILAAAGTLPRASGGRLGPLLPGAVLVGLQVFSLVNLHTSDRYLREQVREAAAHVDRVAQPDDLVLVFGGIDLPWRHYDPGRVRSRIVYADDPATWTPASIPGILAGHARVIVVRAVTSRDGSEAPLLEAVHAASRPETKATFPGIEVEVRALEPAAD